MWWRRRKTDAKDKSRPKKAGSTSTEEMDRKAFFRHSLGLLKRAAVEVSDVALTSRLPSSALIRPPGALLEAAFLLACTRCDACILACPFTAILRAPTNAGVAIATPYLDVVAHQPCRLCEDLPCIESCETGALTELKRSLQVVTRGQTNMSRSSKYS